MTSRRILRTLLIALVALAVAAPAVAAPRGGQGGARSGQGSGVAAQQRTRDGSCLGAGGAGDRLRARQVDRLRDRQRDRLRDGTCTTTSSPAPSE